MTWRTTSLVLAALSSWLLWRDCTRSAAPAAAPECKPAEANEPAPRAHDQWDPPADDEREPPLAPKSGFAINGFEVPAWAAWLAPQPGEDMHAYRDRMLPLAQAVVAPQRARVARSRDDFAALAHLDGHQREVLDDVTREAATVIDQKVVGAFLSGDFDPATFKPMTGVTMARDVLDVIDRSNQKFLASLRDDQKATLAQHPFDFADYLLFSTRWEDLLGLTSL